jgi:hypothetical protein
MWRRTRPMDMSTAGIFMLAVLFTYSAWLTSIVFCSAHDERPLLIAAAAFSLSEWSTGSASGSAVGDADRDHSCFSRTARCRPPNG